MSLLSGSGRNPPSTTSPPQPQVPSTAESTMLAKLEQVLDRLARVENILADKRKAFLTVAEVASLTGRSAYTVRRWIGEGRLQPIKVEGSGPRGRWLIPSDQVDHLLGNCQRGHDEVAATAEFGGSA